MERRLADWPAAPTTLPGGAGGISKADLRRFLQWGAAHLGYPALAEVEAAREWLAVLALAGQMGRRREARSLAAQPAAQRRARLAESGARHCSRPRPAPPPRSPHCRAGAPGCGRRGGADGRARHGDDVRGGRWSWGAKGRVFSIRSSESSAWPGIIKLGAPEALTRSARDGSWPVASRGLQPASRLRRCPPAPPSRPAGAGHLRPPAQDPPLRPAEHVQARAAGPLCCGRFSRHA